MGAERKIDAETLERILVQYKEGNKLSEIYESFSDVASSTTISRAIRSAGVKNRKGNLPKVCSYAKCHKQSFRSGKCTTHYRADLSRVAGECRADFCSRPISAKNVCSKHYQRIKCGLPDITEWVNDNGYVCEYIPNHIQANKDGRVVQHRRIMSDHMGRRLESWETVHHKDGDKLNNTLENLELWAKIHPAGQRVGDLLAFADRIKELYS